MLEDITINQNSILQKAMDKWKRMSQDFSFRQAYELRKKALMDDADRFAHARNKVGQQGKIQMIKGIPIETIVKASKIFLNGFGPSALPKL